MKRQVLVAGALSLLFSMNAQANEGVCIPVNPTKETVMANVHANYMPNFIPVVVNSEKELGLTAKQCNAFNDFRLNKSKGKELIANIIKLEQESNQAALAGVSADEMMAKHEKIAELRKKLTAGKLKCRDFVKSQLTEAQFKQLVTEVYPAKMAAAAKRFGM